MMQRQCQERPDKPPASRGYGAACPDLIITQVDENQLPICVKSNKKTPEEGQSKLMKMCHIKSGLLYCGQPYFMDSVINYYDLPNPKARRFVQHPVTYSCIYSPELKQPQSHNEEGK